MTVYIDQYLLTNIILNFIILRITKSIIKSKSSTMRLFVSSIIGALFAILVLFPQTKVISGTFGKFIFSLILTGISFKAEGFKGFFKNLAVFYFVSFTIGGCGYALYNSKHTDTVKILCTAVFLSYIILNTISSIYEKYFKYDNLIHKLKIKIEEKEAETNCFYDTGNNLRDPITKEPVIITDIKTVKNLLPTDIVQGIENNMDIVEIYHCHHTEIKLRLIPYHTIANNGFILGFVPSEVLIDGKKIGAIIGISASNITCDKNYNAIVNPQII